MDTLTTALSKEFSKVLRECLTQNQMDMVIELNRCETDPMVCHSHDFCDANMVMLEAAENLNITSIVDAVNGVHSEEAEEVAGHVLWSAAWNLAKRSDFQVNS